MTTIGADAESLRTALGAKAPEKAVAALASLLAGELPDVVASGWAKEGRGKLIVAVTGTRVLLVMDSRGGDSAELPLDQLHSVAVAPPVEDRAFVAFLDLDPEAPLRQVRLAPDDAEAVAEAVRARLLELRPATADQPWWTDPTLNIAITLAPGTYHQGPRTDVLDMGTPVQVSVMNTGLTVRGHSTDNKWIRSRRFNVPWSDIRTLSVEGVDQVRSRPSVGAVVAFGVLGLAARRREAESYLVVETGEGDFVFEVTGWLPARLRSVLRPVLDRFGEPGPAEAPSKGDSASDLAEQIRQIAALRDEGLLTDDQFEAKKQELLDRM